MFELRHCDAGEWFALGSKHRQAPSAADTARTVRRLGRAVSLQGGVGAAGVTPASGASNYICTPP